MPKSNAWPFMAAYGASLAFMEWLWITDMLLPHPDTSMTWWLITVLILAPVTAIGPLIPPLIIGGLIAMARFPR